MYKQNLVGTPGADSAQTNSSTKETGQAEDSKKEEDVVDADFEEVPEDKEKKSN